LNDKSKKIAYFLDFCSVYQTTTTLVPIDVRLEGSTTSWLYLRMPKQGDRLGTPVPGPLDGGGRLGLEQNGNESQGVIEHRRSKWRRRQAQSRLLLLPEQAGQG
jgi:hypothetical protein